MQMYLIYSDGKQRLLHTLRGFNKLKQIKKIQEKLGLAGHPQPTPIIIFFETCTKKNSSPKIPSWGLTFS